MSTSTSPPSKRVRLGEDDDEDTPIPEPGRLDDPVESDDNDDDSAWEDILDPSLEIAIRDLLGSR